ncbi:translational GTPase TypA [Helcococcus ovis]|uniref:Large ribosomal subunit assembly factor BipA n=1 Tax=Helcococcus ovis TaxID=72026 RepID=A0A4R9C3M2_9FIRM|nr:translational GTPase TypA [Helcococcus ovis]TFF66007.1 translational GTPase TypA [Helcococcus ovis]TFF67001.1 translational GTPase TypA [Helcococcus ovis]TFF68608.1 translational GTPase TypA [Helcococcus ovis]WNZ01335.1 translational GTPase TypA [Helcococcus ovis]
MKKIRNIAIIAHVDHGKTTLVDSMLKQSGIFRENQEVSERVMDNNDLEKERGITILSKNTAINYNDYKINIIDTPGHADFGGEVERVLKMADGVLLLVDAFEGVMPQTKFVIKKAIELKLPALICLNKIDRDKARPEEVIDEILDLFISLEAPEEYLEAPIIYASGKNGWASLEAGVQKDDLTDLLDTIVEHIPEPKGELDRPFEVLISTTDYSEYLGRIGIGKVEQGEIKVGDPAFILNYNDSSKKMRIKITTIYEFEGLNRVEVQSAKAGSIVAISGVEGIHIGDTLCQNEDMDPIEFVKISEPTLAMRFLVNNSPFAGLEGDFVTSRHLRARLMKEKETDVSLKVEDTESTDAFKVSGRGELHLSVLIENMRREGYEFQVSKPEVLFHEENGKKMEPMEIVTIDVEEQYVGTIINKLGVRKAEMTTMENTSAGYVRLTFKMPARGMIGYRQEFISDTKGTGIINTEFDSYEPYKGDIPSRQFGSLIAYETGKATGYALDSAWKRGNIFIEPGDEVYEGMVVGENPKGLDIEVNVAKRKAKTNIRSSASDDAPNLPPSKKLSLEEMLEFIENDELVEVTPKSLRIRKKILNSEMRYKSKKNS